MKLFKFQSPMLAATLEHVNGVSVADAVRSLKWYDPSIGVNASIKYDGVRVEILNGIARSRNGIPFRSLAMQEIARNFEKLIPDVHKNMYQFSCEVVVNNSLEDSVAFTSSAECNVNIQSIALYVFDLQGAFALETPEVRNDLITCVLGKKLSALYMGDICVALRIVMLHRNLCADEVESFYHQSIQEFQEGIIISNPAAKYKNGRSTLSEGGCIKVKPTKYLTAKIVNYEPLEMHATQRVEYYPSGKIKPSTQVAHISVDNSRAGVLICMFNFRNATTRECRVSSGLTDLQRREIVAKLKTCKSLSCTIAYSELTKYGALRHPRIESIEL